MHNQSFSTRFHRPLIRFKTALVKLISMTLDRTLPADSGMHHSFVAGVLGKSDILPTFISLNYDIVLDRAARSAGCVPEYGFYGNHDNHLEARGKVPFTNCTVP